MAAEGSEREHQGLRFGEMMAGLRLLYGVVVLLLALLVTDLKRFSLVDTEFY